MEMTTFALTFMDRVHPGCVKEVRVRVHNYGPEEIIPLANGRDVPKVCVDALDEYEKIWPGATFAKARPGIVAAILDAIGYFDKEK